MRREAMMCHKRCEWGGGSKEVRQRGAFEERECKIIFQARKRQDRKRAECAWARGKDAMNDARGRMHSSRCAMIVTRWHRWCDADVRFRTMIVLICRHFFFAMRHLLFTTSIIYFDWWYLPLRRPDATMPLWLAWYCFHFHMITSLFDDFDYDFASAWYDIDDTMPRCLIAVYDDLFAAIFILMMMR